jgi:hypothetical protein
MQPVLYLCQPCAVCGHINFMQPVFMETLCSLYPKNSMQLGPDGRTDWRAGAVRLLHLRRDVPAGEVGQRRAGRPHTEPHPLPQGIAHIENSTQLAGVMDFNRAQFLQRHKSGIQVDFKLRGNFVPGQNYIQLNIPNHS